MNEPTFIALGNSKGEISGILKSTDEIIAASKRPTFIELGGGKHYLQFKYCRHCKRPVFEMDKVFCSDVCETVTYRRRRDKKPVKKSFMEKGYEHLLVVALVFIIVYALFARLK